jgi:DNA-directed RNA polymerase specialized sigma24 family protein
MDPVDNGKRMAKPGESEGASSMKDELNGGGGRRLVRGGWNVMQETSRARASRAPRSCRNQDEEAVVSAGFNLIDVYRVLTRWPAQHGGPVQQFAFELALTRVLARIVRRGAAVVQFAAMREVYAYAKRTRRTALIDASRHAKVVRQHLEGCLQRAGARMNGEYLELPPRMVAPDSFEEVRRAELEEWLAVRVGDEDSGLLVSVHADGHTVSELSRVSGAPESTIRSRLRRALGRARAQYEADGVSLN